MATFNGTTLNDTLFGSGLSDLLYGLAGNNSISGGSLGNDTLDGGTGSDTLDGGVGDDLYVVDSTRDVIVETGVEIDDRIQASITIDLNSAVYSGIEHVTLTGTGALNATGDDADNALIGNSGANKLDGRVGADTMAGGAGNDTYEVDSNKDVIVELAGEGTEQVNSSFSFTLSAFVENLTLTGSADSVGTGNALANKITGNDTSNPLDGGDGNDTLTGNGGDDNLTGGNGADSMAGGAGNDSYEVDDIGDKVTESGPATDRDRVDSDITYILGANLENSQELVGPQPIDGTGNSLNNIITGNFNANLLSGLAGNDTLNGNIGDDLLMGGDGNDELQGARNGATLVGGAGNDVFALFASSGKDKDLVADFNGMPGGDLIDVSDLLNGSGVTPGTVTQFLRASISGGSTVLEIDTNGGANSFDELVTLQGYGGGLSGLLANAAIVGIGGTLTATPVTGTTGADTLTADDSSQLLQGLGGNDSLKGGFGVDTLDGGTGADTLAGGGGLADTYVIDNVGDIISSSGGASDLILASITIDLNNKAYDGVEHVTLSGTGALNATGAAGANMLIGNTGANKLDGGIGNDTTIGGAGNDTYEVDSDNDAIVEYANEGTDQVNSSAFAYELSDFVENLTLTGIADINGAGNGLANKITGNVGANALEGGAGNDTLTGNDGNDVLSGDEGADSMVGGKGNDSYFVDDAGDKISESGPATDVDTVFSEITYILGTTLETLTLQGADAIDGTGNALANEIDGNARNNILSGLGGNDTLNGEDGADMLLGGDGNDELKVTSLGPDTDTLLGGAGNDVFLFSVPLLTDPHFAVIGDFNGVPGGDVIDLLFLPSGITAGTASGFLETVTVDGSTTLLVDRDGGANHFVATAQLLGVSTDLAGLLANGSIVGIDNLVPTPVIGTNLADTLAAATSTLIQGLGGNDSLTGSDGFDTLDGGTGADRMTGGKGSDTYIVDSTTDVIVETGTDLDDRIQASITIDLNAAVYAGIEHVTLTGTGALHATGNGGDNLLIGNAGANILDGQVGADTLAGGAGNDTYTVDSLADIVIENPGEGTDQVNSSASFVLGADVENLTLTGTSGISGNGNDLGNKITGNAGDNFLSGNNGNDTLTGNEGNDQFFGGGGADSMNGGTGNDIYEVDDSGDKVSETSASGGIDRVDSSITYTLGSNFENLTLANGRTIDGTGNSLSNSITGGDGDNVLSGLVGNDTLAGADGKDLLLGGDGADLLQAAAGADTLAGGTGSDRFAFDANSLDGRDVIADFAGGSGGDVIDLSDLLSAFDPAVNNINNFLRTSIADGSTTLEVDQDGNAGGANFVAVAVIEGVTTDVLGLLNNGSLVLAD